MEQLRNIPKTSRCREDLHSGAATRVLPLRVEGKGLCCLGGSKGCLLEPHSTLTQSTASKMATKGIRSAWKRLQVPPGSSQPPAPTSGISHLPPNTGGPGLRTTHNGSVTLHVPHWAPFPGLQNDVDNLLHTGWLCNTGHPVSTTVPLALGEVEAPAAGDPGGLETWTPSRVEPDPRRHRVTQGKQPPRAPCA